MRRTLWVAIAGAATVLLVFAGVALGAFVNCSLGGPGGNCAGTSGDDQILGSGLADRINAKDGSDVVDARNGADTLLGAGDVDFLHGENGKDVYFGGAGGDDISESGTHTGADRMNGGPDGDNFEGGGSGDVIKGGRGPDNMFGDTGNDLIKGGRGSDPLMEGERGNDRLSGGHGHDDIDSADGENPGHRDSVECGTGMDHVIANKNDKVAGDCEQVTRVKNP